MQVQQSTQGPALEEVSAIGYRAAQFQLLDLQPPRDSFLAEVLAGLSQLPKVLHPRLFYDARGSRLFEQICALPEYYPTRAELAILQNNAAEIATCIGQDTLIVEYGSGSSRKVRILLDAAQPAGYVAIEISQVALREASEELSLLYPCLPIIAICADYNMPLPALDLPNRRRVAFFPGSTIGNFTPVEALRFLQNVHEFVGAGGGLLIGVDLKKDRALLEAAYNDSRGITAEFNLNLLRRINRELGANFDVEQIRHRAFYNDTLGRIEMHLVSHCDQQVSLAGHTISFKAGESIHTESSYKYTLEEFSVLASHAGFRSAQVWTDSDNLFSVHYLSA